MMYQKTLVKAGLQAREITRGDQETWAYQITHVFVGTHRCKTLGRGARFYRNRRIGNPE